MAKPKRKIRRLPLKKLRKKAKKKVNGPVLPVVVATAEVDDDPWGDDGLSDRQRLFVKAYVGPAAANATKAAAMAGYRDDNRDSLAVMASRTLHRGNVQRAISRLITAKLGSAEWVKAGIVEIANGNAADFLKSNDRGQLVVDLNKLAAAGALGLVKEIKQEGIGTNDGDVAIIKQTFRLHDRLRALELLAKINGQLKDVHEHSGVVTLNQAAATQGAMAKLMSDPEAMTAALLLADRLKPNDPAPSN